MRNLPIWATFTLLASVAIASGVSVPAGTEVVIRTNEYIRTSEATPNRTFLANVNQDVRDAEGMVLIPKGADVGLTVRKVSKGELAIDMNSISVNGIKYAVDTQEISESNRRDGVGKNKRTGEMVGGGAVVGAIHRRSSRWRKRRRDWSSRRSRCGRSGPDAEPRQRSEATRRIGINVPFEPAFGNCRAGSG